MEKLQLKPHEETRKHRKNRDKLRVAAGKGLAAVIAGIGYILSPASWWNDAVVNIPLALIIARILSPITGLPMTILFTIAYWATNVIGIALMALGGASLAGKRLNKKNLAISLTAATLYTILVVLILKYV